jgi:hypothetical protein
MLAKTFSSDLAYYIYNYIYIHLQKLHGPRVQGTAQAAKFLGKKSGSWVKCLAVASWRTCSGDVQ